MKIYLYSTLGCHLCEQAKVILWPLLSKYQLRLEEVDISTSDELIESYGIRIPVLAAEGIVEELNWPFSPDQAEGFFAKLAH